MKAQKHGIHQKLGTGNKLLAITDNSASQAPARMKSVAPATRKTICLDRIACSRIMTPSVRPVDNSLRCVQGATMALSGTAFYAVEPRSEPKAAFIMVSPIDFLECG